MSDRITNAMRDSAMEYLAELLGVNFIHPHKRGIEPKPGDITFEDHDMRNARYYFGIYRYEASHDSTTPIGTRVLRPHRPISASMPQRELHDHVRFMANVLYAHRGILARAREMGEL